MISLQPLIFYEFVLYLYDGFLSYKLDVCCCDLLSYNLGKTYLLMSRTVSVAIGRLTYTPTKLLSNQVR